MHIFGKENEFEIKYHTLKEKYKINIDDEKNPSKFECYGDMHFVVKGKDLFAIDCKSDRSLTTYTGSIFTVIEFFCEKLKFHIIDHPFPQMTIAQTAVDMMDEIKLVDGEDNDISKYADFDFDSIDVELYSKIDQWGWNHGFVGNSEDADLPNVYMRKVNGNQIEISWDSTTRFRRGKDEYYFMHDKGVEYIDLKLYRDTVIAFCLDTFERLGKHFPLFIDDFKAELQKAIDVKL